MPEIHAARRAYEQSLPHLEKTNYTRFISHAQTGLGRLESLEGRDDTALALFREALKDPDPFVRRCRPDRRALSEILFRYTDRHGPGSQHEEVQSVLYTPAIALPRRNHDRGASKGG